MTEDDEREQKYGIPNAYFLLCIAVATVYEVNGCQVMKQGLARTLYLIWSHVFKVIEWTEKCAKEMYLETDTLYLLGRYETFKAMETSSENIPIREINEMVLFEKQLCIQNKRWPCSLN